MTNAFLIAPWGYFSRLAAWHWPILIAVQCLRGNWWPIVQSLLINNRLWYQGEQEKENCLKISHKTPHFQVRKSQEVYTNKKWFICIAVAILVVGVFTAAGIYFGCELSMNESFGKSEQIPIFQTSIWRLMSQMERRCMEASSGCGAGSWSQSRAPFSISPKQKSSGSLFISFWIRVPWETCTGGPRSSF